MGLLPHLLQQDGACPEAITVHTVGSVAPNLDVRKLAASSPMFEWFAVN